MIATRQRSYASGSEGTVVWARDMAVAVAGRHKPRCFHSGGLDKPQCAASVSLLLPAGFSDDMAAANRSRAVSASVDLTDCLQRAGIQTAVEPTNPADEKSGPSRTAVKFSKLKLYALAPDGTDMTPYYDFGPHVVSWTRPLKISVKGGGPVASLMSDALGVKAVADGVGVVFSQAVGYM